MNDDIAVLALKDIASMVHFIRGQRVLIDSDLAYLYGVETKNINLAVKRNVDRFPADFMFQLTQVEATSLRFQNETSNASTSNDSKRGGRTSLPYAFTEQGVAMLSSVLRSQRAIEVNIAIMRAFVEMRRMIDGNRELATKIDSLEKKYDEQFKVVFVAIKQLMKQEEKPPRKIGFK